MTKEEYKKKYLKVLAFRRKLWMIFPVGGLLFFIMQNNIVFIEIISLIAVITIVLHSFMLHFYSYKAEYSVSTDSISLKQTEKTGKEAKLSALLSLFFTIMLFILISLSPLILKRIL